MANPTDPIDVDALVEAGTARAEATPDDGDDCCENGCQCYFPRPSYDEDYDPDDTFDGSDCDHCPNCCSCVPCMYVHHA
ncbi:hypothetical protein GCM10010399_63760 [Dactylosporangium fulvum]|uniref:Uncharacterized protein n=1 Tax=Dactylosporangium fulvum TaxID=53359 RepID=A0ABY5W9M7_9ACTN|nr:hypothetical protein [Dactylosporangium fulvum]UWP85801.1 hypothetical protein Dfulv_16775 [Dactylosporangium fulvum]